MNYSPLISIIIPIYNSQKYLHKCLNSIINQTYKNLEIICINDCSTDNSQKIVEEYIEKDSRIKIINNPENIGPGLSRNKGLELAKGEYVHCLDSDDCMELNAYEILVQYLNKIGEVDIIQFSYYLCSKFKKTVIKYDTPYKLTNIYVNPYLIQELEMQTWVKLIRNEFIKNNNLYFNSHFFFEDVDYTIREIITASSFYVINETLMYHKKCTKNSLYAKRYNYFYVLDNMIEKAETYVCKMPTEQQMAIMGLVTSLIYIHSAEAYYNYHINFDELKSLINSNYKKNVVEDNPFFNFKDFIKLYDMLNKYNKYQFFILYNIKGRIRKFFPTYMNLYSRIKHSILSCIH